MEFGFLVKIRSFLIVDQVIIKCFEVRYYYEFKANGLVRESRHFINDYQSYVALNGRPVYTSDDSCDQIIPLLKATKRLTQVLCKK